MPRNFRDINYLLNGSDIQKAAYSAIENTEALKILQPYDPILVGSLPIDIFIIGSDLDIICCTPDLVLFEENVKCYFSYFPSFEIHVKQIHGTPTVIARFTANKFAFEIWGQAIPVNNQAAFRHLLVEHNILEKEGDNFKQKVIQLKQAGVKTEPAFAQLLGLQGDPYIALLQYVI